MALNLVLNLMTNAITAQKKTEKWEKPGCSNLIPENPSELVLHP